jgi:hypothetical protein
LRAASAAAAAAASTARRRCCCWWWWQRRRRRPAPTHLLLLLPLRWLWRAKDGLRHDLLPLVGVRGVEAAVRLLKQRQLRLLCVRLRRRQQLDVRRQPQRVTPVGDVCVCVGGE